MPPGQAIFGPYVGGPDGRDGARFFSGGAPFYAFAQIDVTDGVNYDWGFPLIPSDRLSPQVLVSDGRSCTEPGHTLDGESCDFGNLNNARSPVWIMPNSGTNVPVHIAYDGRLPTCPAAPGDYDSTISLNRLRIGAVTELADLDMSGARIWTCQPGVNLVIAWGQDPPRSYSGDNQGPDLGTSVLPLPSIQIEKSSAFAIDSDGDGAISPGDTITFTLAVVNNGADPANIMVADTLPEELIYQLNSTTFRVEGVRRDADSRRPSPEVTIPARRRRAQHDCGSEITIGPGEVAEFSYVTVIDPRTDCTRTLENRGKFEARFPNTGLVTEGHSSEIIVLQCNPGVDVEKSTNGADADDPTGPYIDEGAPVTWSYEVTNIGDIDLVDVSLEDDVLGPITSCTPAVPSPFAVGDSFTCTATGSAGLGQFANVATVSGTSSISETQVVSDTDPVDDYFGQNCPSSSSSTPMAADANLPPGPLIESSELPVVDVCGDECTATCR